MTPKALTPSQKSASMHHLGPALTLAIPGSGKTTLLLHRLMHLVENHGVNPSEILTLTFSKAAADDMASRFSETFGHLNHRFSFMTIHKFAFSLFRQYMTQTGKQMTLIEEGAHKYSILSQIYKKHHHDTLTEDDFETLSNQIGQVYNLRLSAEQTAAHEFQWTNLFEMARDYHNHKKKHQLYDFDDMLLSALKMLQNSEALRLQLHKRYRFIQVDEAQDTSKLQFDLIECLLGEEKNLFIVADDDQSIYGFRGAYPDYLLNFNKRFNTAKIYYLDENFRSDAHIVDAAKALISKNTLRYEKPMRATKPQKQKPSVVIFDDLTKRNQYIIEGIDDKSISKVVLYRNKVSAISLLDALERNQISFQIKDAPIKEFSHWMLEDLMAFFTLALVPQDFESFSRIAFKMNGFISREMLNHVRANQRGRSIFSTLVEIPFLQDYQTRTQEKLQSQFEALNRLRPYDAIHYIETELGYLDYLKSNTQRLGMSLNFARTRLDAFKAIAKPLKTGFDFINRIADLKSFLLENVHNASADITLSTLHGAKGLEFDRVFMIDVNAQIFPGYKATTNDALDEERRLFYVGLTRAKSQFELLHVEFINGSYNPNSRFIEELLSEPFTDHIFNNVTGKPATG